MAIIDLKLPPMGESIAEATIIHWNKTEGDHVDKDETILEVATDKVDSEVPSGVEGTIVEILFKEDDVVPVGETIARIEAAEDAIEEHDNLQLLDDEDENDEVESEEELPQRDEEESKNKKSDNQMDNSRFYSPLVMKIAAEEGIALRELEQINGSGLGGRVTKKDILQYVENKKSEQTTQAKTDDLHREDETITEGTDTTSEKQEKPVTEVKPYDFGRENVEVIKMDRRRRMIAEHMVRSKQISPHVTSFSEADVTNIVKWRNRVKKRFQDREGEKLTFTPLFIEAIVKCIKKFPLINSSVDGDNILVKKDINIGMATALKDGSLIVPVIKKADQLNLVGLAKQVNGLAHGARSGTLPPDATQDGTFTMTNVGTFDSLAGTPIINQPQVAILAVGAIKKKPMVVETAQGDGIAIRHMMYLSMSYDHRVVDGSLGATFLTAVARELEHFNLDREF